MQFSGQDCVKQKRKPVLIRSSLVLPAAYLPDKCQPNKSVNRCDYFQHSCESLLPFVGFISSQFACCLEGQAESF